LPTTTNRSDSGLYDVPVDFIPAAGGGPAEVRIGEGASPVDQATADRFNRSAGTADPELDDQSSTRADAPGFKEVRGQVDLRCWRAAGGALSRCTVLSESPPGLGLGEYALILAGDGGIGPHDPAPA